MRTLRRVPNCWTKTEKVLNHLVLVGLRDGVPPPLVEIVKEQIQAAKKRLQLRAHPLEITKPLLELEAINCRYGLKPRGSMDQKFEPITTTLHHAAEYSFNLIHIKLYFHQLYTTIIIYFMILYCIGIMYKFSVKNIKFKEDG